MTHSTLTPETAAMVRGWLAEHRGDVDAVARWMSRSLRIGRPQACRALAEAARNAEAAP